jgi:hypothetical protein
MDQEQAVTWFGLSLIICGLARALNRSGFWWWFFGVLTGPFALFILVVFCGRAETGDEMRARWERGRKRAEEEYQNVTTDHNQ